MKKYNGKYRIDTARAKWWDYKNEGDYFITICTKNMEHLFGYIKNEQMILNEYGKIVSDCWYDLPNHYPNIVLGEFQIMPNHIHCIVGIDNSVFPVETGLRPVCTESPDFAVETGLKPFCTKSPFCAESPDFAVETGLRPVSTESPVCKNPDNTESQIKIHGVFEFIRALKSFSSRRINEIRDSKGVSNWQERFHDHIIRNDEEYYRINDYIINNPNRWKEDRFNKEIDSTQKLSVL